MSKEICGLHILLRHETFAYNPKVYEKVVILVYSFTQYSEPYKAYF